MALSWEKSPSANVVKCTLISYPFCCVGPDYPRGLMCLKTAGCPDFPRSPDLTPSQLPTHAANEMKRRLDTPESTGAAGRRQPQVSCDFCRRKKLKCDRGAPCSSCSVRRLTCSNHAATEAGRPLSAPTRSAQILCNHLPWAMY